MTKTPCFFHSFLALLVFVSASLDPARAADNPPIPTLESPSPGVAGKGLAGIWMGSIKPMANVELHLALEVTSAVEGSFTGVLVSIDQGKVRIPVSTITEHAGAVHVEVSSIGASFDGKFNGDGSELIGQWKQGGGVLALSFSRQASAVPAIAGDSPGVSGKGIDGRWEGTLKVMGGAELRLALEIQRDEGGNPAGVLISIDQGKVRVPMTALVESGGTIRFETSSIGGAFEGKFNADGSELTGTWKQGGFEFPLVFKRLAKDARVASTNRPQEPRKPYPYKEEEVVVENKPAGIQLAGTLTIPSGAGPHPAVVLITGSGPQDRDETVMGHKPFLLLADYLTRQGVVVLRCDDRGTAKSTGDFGKAVNGDFAEDALAAVAYLRARKEVDVHRIGLLGHSEGGIVAPRAAAKSGDIAFIVLLAGVGLNMEEIILRQSHDIPLAMGMSEEKTAQNIEIIRELFHLLKAENDPAKLENTMKKALHEKLTALAQTMTEQQRANLGMTEAMLEGHAKFMSSPWFRDMMNYDPLPVLRAVKCPVLALNGEKDLQVSPKENLAAIRTAVRAGGNRQVETFELPRLNHLFQTCKTGAPIEYSRIEETFDPAALKLIANWILKVTEVDSKPML